MKQYGINQDTNLVFRHIERERRYCPCPRGRLHLFHTKAFVQRNTYREKKQISTSATYRRHGEWSERGGFSRRKKFANRRRIAQGKRGCQTTAGIVVDCRLTSTDRVQATAVCFVVGTIFQDNVICMTVRVWRFRRRH